MQDFRKIQPQGHDIESLKLVEPGQFTLDNGIKVYTVNAGSEDLLKLDLIFNAGTIYQHIPLQAAQTNKCLQEGTTGFTSREIAEKVDFYGAFLRNSVNKDDARITLYCLGKHFQNLLPVVQEVALQPRFPEDEIQTIISKSRHEFLVNLEKVKYVARLRFSEYIFGKCHPYSTPLSEADYKNVNPDVIRDFHKRFYASNHFYIMISGQIPKNIRETLNQYFGRHRVDLNHAEMKMQVPVTTPDKFQLIEKENSLQSALRIGKVLFNKTDPDFIKMKVVNTILGGYFGSRLMSNIREDKGYTYGIGSMVTSLKHSGLFTISSEVGVDVREKAVDEIFMEIRRLATDLVPDEELNLVKNYMLGNFLRNADGPFALSEMVKSVVDYGFTMDYFNRYIQTIKNITAKEIRELTVKYLDPHTLVTLVVGK